MPTCDATYSERVACRCRREPGHDSEHRCLCTATWSDDDAD